MSLAADGQDGNGLQLEKLRLNVSSCFHAPSENRYLWPWNVFSLRFEVISSCRCSKIMFSMD